MQDGLLNVTIISPFPKYMAPTIGLKLFSQRIGTSKYVESFKVSDILIERPSPDCVHFDGEPTIMGERLQVGIMPQALKVFVP